MNSKTNVLKPVLASNTTIFHSKRSVSHRLLQGLAFGLSASLLSACGGGGGDSLASDSSVSLPTVTVSPGYTPQPGAPVVATPVQSPTTSTPAIVAGTAITDIRIQNTGPAQTNVPFTFGQVIAAGQMARTEGLAAKLEDGSLVRLQADIKATHADGSVRHVIVSGVLPSLATGQTRTLTLVKSTASETSSVTPQSMASAGLSSKVSITVDNVLYTASLADALATGKNIAWLSGAIANEWIMEVPLKNASGAAHPLLTARFDVRWYSALSKKARVEVAIENTKTFVAGTRNLTYNVDIEVGGRSVYSKANLTHYHHSRWRKIAWWDAATEPALHFQHNTAYLIASRAVSNYDQTAVPGETTLAGLATQLNESNTGPMTVGPVEKYMPSTGGRGDIGPLPNYAVMYLLSQDKRAKDVMMAAAEGSGTWSIHYRDENTGYAVRTDSEANKYISLHENLANTGPLPVPRCANADNRLCASPFVHDLAHQPSLAFLPYLVTGDYYYLEEMQFWAATNPLGTGPGYSGNGQGLLRWGQVRGQAWGMRTLGHVAYITPDANPMKGYFTKQLDNNLNFYHETYVVGNPNKLGAYDGSGRDSYAVSSSAPWQDDFFTWSFGYLSELGFSKALPILQWKAKYPVGRMTAPGYCWIQAATYSSKFRDSMSSPIYESFAQLYAANFSGDIYNDNGGLIKDPLGTRYLDQPCGTQAQADWFSRAMNTKWENGRMTGYADSALGYPANMQPALAVAATSGIPDAELAWSRFTGRAAKPDYSKNPQWAIIPRK